MMILLLHSVLAFALLMLLCGIGRLVYLRKVVTPHRREVSQLKCQRDMLAIACSAGHDLWRDSQKECQRLEQNLSVACKANDDLVGRHLLNRAEIQKAQQDVSMRSVVIKHLRAANEELIRERNALVDELANNSKAGSLRTAKKCLRG